MKIIALTFALLVGGTASAQMAPMPTDGTVASQTTMPMQAGYPPCSATVIDQCIQSNARESDTKGGPPANMNMARHHRMMKKHHRSMKNHRMVM